MSERQRLSRIRIWLWLFVAGLLLAGITAFPLEWESRMLSQWLHGSGTWAGDAFPAMRAWISQVRYGLAVSYHRYPWLAYGTHWLAFGHITIAVAFAGPIRDPVRNKWVVQLPTGTYACSKPLASLPERMIRTWPSPGALAGVVVPLDRGGVSADAPRRQDLTRPAASRQFEGEACRQRRWTPPRRRQTPRTCRETSAWAPVGAADGT
jgi:hypothetical protein